MKVSQLGIDLIVHFESLHDGDLSKIGLQPKQDCSGYWTIGYGHLLTDLSGRPLSGVDGFTKLRDMYPDYLDITTEEAEDLLIEDLANREDRLNSLNLKLSQQEYDAIMSFIFNCGFSNFISSTLYRMVKVGYSNVEDAFMAWNKSGGKIWKGLIARRKSEWTLFSTGELKFYN